jgi:arsenate reductase
MTIYHNPKCKKSRETLQRIRDAGTEPEIVEYLKTPPSPDDLRDILQKLGMNAEDIIRKGEKVYKEEYKGKELSEDEWLDALHKNPKLIERPIVIEDDRAVLGRPPENVDELL